MLTTSHTFTTFSNVYIHNFNKYVDNIHLPLLKMLSNFTFTTFINVDITSHLPNLQRVNAILRCQYK